MHDADARRSLRSIPRHDSPAEASPTPRLRASCRELLKHARASPRGLVQTRFGSPVRKRKLGFGSQRRRLQDILALGQLADSRKGDRPLRANGGELHERHRQEPARRPTEGSTPAMRWGRRARHPTKATSKQPQSRTAGCEKYRLARRLARRGEGALLVPEARRPTPSARRMQPGLPGQSCGIADSLWRRGISYS